MAAASDSKAFASMNAALRRRCTAIQKLLADAAVEEIDKRYKVGAIIRAILEGEDTYGERAVERVAQALGREAATLYRYAAVAKMWSESEMRTLSRRPNAHGEPLSWSHWVELTRVPARWRYWLERALEESWSSRRLARELDAETREVDESEAEDTTRAALLEAVKDAERWNAQVKSFAAALDRIARSPRHAQGVDELLARAVVVFGDVARRTGDVLARVRELAPEEQARPGEGERRFEN